MIRRPPAQNLVEEDHPWVEGVLTRGDLPCDLSAIQRDYQIGDFLVFDAAVICTGEWVRLKCQYGCSSYGTSWSCPPATPDVDRVRGVLKEYRLALLLRSSIDGSAIDGDEKAGREARLNHWKGTVEAEKQLFRSGYYRAFALNAGACPLCEKCSYPDSCAHPQELRPSISSFSIDVFKTLENLGVSLKVLRDKKVHFDRYSIILVQ